MTDKKRVTVASIVEAWLKSNGYDGLCTEDCGCGLEDLMPCCEDCGGCEPGYAHTATGLEGDVDVDAGETYYSPEPTEQTP